MDFLRGQEYGLSYYGQEGVNVESSAYSAGISWIDYTLANNPGGVMLVLRRYGMIGFLSPNNFAELRDAANLLIEQYGDDAVEDLLRAHPDFDVIRGVPAGRSDNYSSFSESGNTRQNIITLDRLLIAGGVFLAAYILLK